MFCWLHFILNWLIVNVVVSSFINKTIKFIDKHLAIVFQNVVLVIAFFVLVIDNVEKCRVTHFLRICTSHLLLRITAADWHVACSGLRAVIFFGYIIKISDFITFNGKLKHKVHLHCLRRIIKIWTFTDKKGCPMSHLHVWDVIFEFWDTTVNCFDLLDINLSISCFLDSCEISWLTRNSSRWLRWLRASRSSRFGWRVNTWTSTSWYRIHTQKGWNLFKYNYKLAWSTSSLNLELHSSS